MTNLEKITIRCVKCNKLLGYIEGEYEIKCPRCGKINSNCTYECARTPIKE